MSRNVWRWFLIGSGLCPLISVGCAGHRHAATELNFLPRESECEVDVRNPSAETMQLWAHVIDGKASSDPVTLLLGTFGRGSSNSIPVPPGYRYSHFTTLGTITARGGLPSATEHCYERRP